MPTKPNKFEVWKRNIYKFLKFLCIKIGLGVILNISREDNPADSNCETKIVFRKCTFSWTISQYSFRVRSANNLQSPEFSAVDDEFKWRLVHCTTNMPDHWMECRNALGFNIRFTLISARDNDLEKYSPVFGDIQISVITPDGEKLRTQKSGFKLESTYDYYDLVRQPTLNVFASDSKMKEWTFQDQLRIFCEIDYYKKTDIVHIFTLSDSNPFEDSARNVSSDLERILNDARFSDLTITVEGKDYPVHKAILSARSSVFEAMLRNDMQESEKNHIVIADIDGEIFEEMLHYIYTGKAKNLKRTAIDLLALADKYDLKVLRRMCEQTLIENLSANDVARVLAMADMHHAEKLKSYAIRFIKKNCASFKRPNKAELWNVLDKSHPQLMKDVLNAVFEK